MSFSDDINRFKKNTEKAATMVFRGSSLEIFKAVIKRSPVGDPTTWQNAGLWRSIGFVNKGYAGGRFRANWRAKINHAHNGTTTSTNGAEATRSAIGETSIAKLGQSIYFVNNLPYSLRLENGYSKQAPIGMVKATVIEWRRTVIHQARKHRK